MARIENAVTEHNDVLVDVALDDGETCETVVYRKTHADGSTVVATATRVSRGGPGLASLRPGSWELSDTGTLRMLPAEAV